MYTSNAISTRNVAMNIYETLMTRDEKNEPILELAESMVASPDGLSYVFKLRTGVRFHNASSSAARTSWLRSIAMPRSASSRAMLDNVEKWEAPDASTFSSAARLCGCSCQLPALSERPRQPECPFRAGDGAPGYGDDAYMMYDAGDFSRRTPCAR